MQRSSELNKLSVEQAIARVMASSVVAIAIAIVSGTLVRRTRHEMTLGD